MDIVYTRREKEIVTISDSMLRSFKSNFAWWWRSFLLLVFVTPFLLLLPLKEIMAFSSSNNQQRPSQYYPKFFQELPSMVGKTIVITGCSKGLGFVTAKGLVEKGAMVYMLNRKSKTSDAAQQQLGALATEKQHPEPVVVDCDLLDFTSVRNAATTIREFIIASDDKNGGGIDVLCNNAGIMLQPDQSSVDGYDITASTNVLSHFLLTKELMPLLLEKGATKNGGEARIVNMSSASGYGPSPFNPQFFEKRGGNCGGSQASYERYHQSKLANLAFTSALHDRLQQSNTNIKALACTPGVCGTDMFLHATAVMNGGQSSRRDMVPSAEDGCMAQLKCICDPNVSSGDLWGPAFGRNANGRLEKTPIGPPKILVDAKVKDSFWNICEQAVGKFDI